MFWKRLLKKKSSICFVNRSDCIKWRLWLQEEKLWIVTIICQKSCNIYIKLIKIMFDNQSGQKNYDSCKIFFMCWLIIFLSLKLPLFPPCLVKLHNFSILFLQRKNLDYFQIFTPPSHPQLAIQWGRVGWNATSIQGIEWPLRSLIMRELWWS